MLDPSQLTLQLVSATDTVPLLNVNQSIKSFLKFATHTPSSIINFIRFKSSGLLPLVPTALICSNTHCPKELRSFLDTQNPIPQFLSICFLVFLNVRA